MLYSHVTLAFHHPAYMAQAAVKLGVGWARSGGTEIITPGRWESIHVQAYPTRQGLLYGRPITSMAKTLHRTVGFLYPTQRW